MKPVLTPAYGRDYKSKAQLKEALEAGEDFVMNSPTQRSTYINKQGLLRYFGPGMYQFRYGKSKKATMLEVK